MCLRNICSIRRVNRVRNSLIREILMSVECNEKERKWLGHAERMRKEMLVKRVYRVNMEGNRERGRLQKRRENEVKELLMGTRFSKREGMELSFARHFFMN